MAIDKAIVIQPEDATLYNQKGILLQNLKRYLQAEAAYDKAIQLSPRASFYNNRGLLYAKQQKWELALADYNQALQLNPNYANAYYNRGIVRYQMGDRQGSIQDLQKSAELFYQQGNMSLYQQAIDVLKQI
ncbi:MAG: tetratricopeptide repeat protein [Hydrococcus sp. RU_2_2]|nr:tetratricopeptide repeat protein [Hydrococcus sp. RU_2_2]